jgi:hypothetical protein
MARPIKLTPETQERVLKAIRAGNTREATAEYAGIGRSTLYRWIELGERRKKGIHREFWDALKKAESECEIRNVGIIQLACQGGEVIERKTIRKQDGATEVVEKYTRADWTAAAWWLERRRPGAWGRKDRHEITGQDGGAIQHAHQLTDLERDEAIATIVARLGAESDSPDEERPGDGLRPVVDQPGPGHASGGDDSGPLAI